MSIQAYFYMPMIVKLPCCTTLYLKFFYELPHIWLWDGTSKVINNLSVSQSENSWQGTNSVLLRQERPVV